MKNSLYLSFGIFLTALGFADSPVAFRSRMDAKIQFQEFTTISAPACDLNENSISEPSLCAPDPYEDICRNVRPQTAESFKQIQDETKNIQNNYAKYYKKEPSSFEEDLDGVTQMVLKIGAEFKESIQKNPALNQRSKSIVSSMIDSCKVVRPVLGAYALIQREGGFIEKILNGQKPAPEDCKIGINWEMMAACIKGESFCRSILFHEFGHFLHACDYLVDISTTNKKIEAFQTDLMEATECLTVTSNPRRGPETQCFPMDLGKLSTLENRCRSDNLPTQWQEAEADAWGATALSDYFKSQIPNLRERNDQTLKALEMSCLFKFSSQVSPPSKLSRAIHHYVLPPLCRQGSFMVGLAAGVLDSALTEKAWDPHQKWAFRMNRNFLRNTDLREALGCSPDNPAIGATCAPGNATYLLLPK